ncbi:TlpA family protein disulfide reductase [Luteibacter sp. CQ10]|uniref:TlpA family protein disulfide reductase n=1 Tax=Luteibacter sp. CQ10 TaxID=2805821 RepID=UPI0034A243A7
MSKRLAAFALSAASAVAIASPSGAEETIPPAMRDQLAIPHDYRLTFQDQDGKPLSYARFRAAMAARPFDVIKDPAGHQAILKLESDARIAQNLAEHAKPKALAAEGHPFPSFHATTLDGTPLSTASLHGKPFVASFFFAQCGPCIAETPVLSAFHRAHPDVQVVAFTFDDAATARTFVKERGLNWPVVSDQQALADQAGITVYPTILLVDGQGIVAKAAHTDTIAPKGRQLDLADLGRWVGTPR